MINNLIRGGELMKKYIILTVVLAFLFTVPVIAEEVSGDNGNGPPQTSQNMDDVLGIKAKQKEEIKKIREELLKKNTKLAKKRDELREEVAELSDADEPDYDKLGKRIKELNEKRTEMTLNTIKAEKEILKKLTKEQREKLKKIRAKRRDPWSC